MTVASVAARTALAAGVDVLASPAGRPLRASAVKLAKEAATTVAPTRRAFLGGSLALGSTLVLASKTPLRTQATALARQTVQNKASSLAWRGASQLFARRALVVHPRLNGLLSSLAKVLSGL